MRKNRFGFIELRRLQLARYQGFQLDSFQQKGIAYIDSGHSILVSAPTGSGKTLIAQYAIEMILEDKRRKKIIYTSPLKALSNQKYLEFTAAFGEAHVGLLTGDITINRDARVLIMTTEILRNMLYQNPVDLLDVAYVVFDEIHYLNDPFRGAVWEESLVLLLPDIKLILLSATIANAEDLADWLSSVRQEPIQVVFHDKRSVPLRQFALEAGMLREVNGKGAEFSLTADYFFVNPLLCLTHFPEDFFPVLVFVFSRRRCGEYAVALAQNAGSFLTAKEQEAIQHNSDQYLNTLDPTDRNLANVKRILWLVKHGIAIHHAGLLPSLKSFVENLFAQNLIKVIFATETFALGVNFPAKSTFFPDPAKWDGQEYRYLTSSEYIQMSGRAGRRGIDSEGFAIIDANQLPFRYAQTLMHAPPAPLQSQFRIGYNLIVNLRLDSVLEPLEFLNRSFYYYQSQKARITHNQAIENKLAIVETNLAEIDLPCVKAGEEGIKQLKEYQDILKKISHFKRKQKALSRRSLPGVHKQIATEFCVPGRVVYLRKLGWAVCFNTEKRHKKRFIICFSPKTPGELIKRSIKTLFFSDVVLDISQMNKNNSQLLENLERLKDNPPLLTSYADLRKKKCNEVRQQEYELYQQEIGQAEEREQTLLCHGCSFLDDHLKTLDSEANLQRKRDLLKNQLWPSGNKLLQQFEALEIILSDLGYINSQKKLTKKGLMLSQISNEHDLLLVEGITSGECFPKLGVAEMNGLLSAFVTSKEDNDRGVIPESVACAFKQLLIKRRQIIAEERKRGIAAESFLEFNLAMYEEIFQWSQGRSLAEILAISPFSEGEILSVLRRLINLLQQLVHLPEAGEFPLNLGQAIKALRRGEAFVKAPINIS